ncbi:response regulator transcription factor [Microbulbifer sp. ANSA003]|uniref:response regulator transcription factor n=1 Tax=Microbulbifer sp. ANSA003 TaxID=3243360 RepID=UPI0040430069
MEDDIQQRELLTDLMEARGFHVKGAASLAQMYTNLDDFGNKIDAILLDLSLPDGDALGRIAQLRRRLSCGLLVVSLRNTEAARVEAIEQGADDFIAKPYSPAELVARIKTVIARANKGKENKILRYKGWYIDQRYHDISDPCGNFIDLSLSEYILWVEFLSHPGITLSRDRLLDLFGNSFRDVSDRSIDTLVSRLRRKISDQAKPPQIIQTVRGEGYRFTGAMPAVSSVQSKS